MSLNPYSTQITLADGRKAVIATNWPTTPGSLWDVACAISASVQASISDQIHATLAEMSRPRTNRKLSQILTTIRQVNEAGANLSMEMRGNLDAELDRALNAAIASWQSFDGPFPTPAQSNTQGLDNLSAAGINVASATSEGTQIHIRSGQPAAAEITDKSQATVLEQSSTGNAPVSAAA